MQQGNRKLVVTLEVLVLHRTFEAAGPSHKRRAVSVVRSEAALIVSV